MTDLSEDAAWEAWRNAPQREEWELRDAQMGFGGGFAAAREYSKQREEKIVRVWTCMSCGHIACGQSCEACGDEAMPGEWVTLERARKAEQREEKLREALERIAGMGGALAFAGDVARAALAENGDSDAD